MMAYYTALINAWNSASLPVGVTGTFPLTGTPDQKLTAFNGWTIHTGVAIPALLTPSQILNAIQTADFTALTTTQLQQLQLLLSGESVDASQGTQVRGAIQSMFTGKTTTLNALTALVAPYDNPTVPYWKFIGYPAQINGQDLVNAGLS